MLSKVTLFTTVTLALLAVAGPIAPEARSESIHTPGMTKRSGPIVGVFDVEEAIRDIALIEQRYGRNQRKRHNLDKPSQKLIAKKNNGRLSEVSSLLYYIGLDLVLKHRLSGPRYTACRCPIDKSEKR